MRNIFILLMCLPFVSLAQSPGSDESKKGARLKLDSIRERVLKGETFSSLASKYSEDPGSSANGGTYRKIVRGTMVDEFEQVAFRLKPMEVSEVFETQYGFHFIQLLTRTGDELDLRHILIIPK